MTGSISCLIVDDDPFIQNLLSDKLQQYFPDIVILAQCNNGHDGIAKISELLPELVFLDVEMSDMTGFELLTQVDHINFKIIFITSYKHYAIKAIKFNALDYLLKPFDLGELKNAIKRFKESRRDSYNPLTTALTNIKSKYAKDQILILRTQEGGMQLALNEIIRVEGDRNYSYVHLIKNRRELVSKTLSAIEELLEDKGFFRCHKSHLVNKAHIVGEPKNLHINLSNQTTIPISRRKKEAFYEWYKTSDHD